MDVAVLNKLKTSKYDKILVMNAPDAFNEVLKEYQGAVATAITGKYEYAQLFITSQAEFEAQGKALAEAIEGDGMFWVCYPKGTSKKYKKVDCNRDTIRGALVDYGYEGVAIVSLDEDWSALRLRHRDFIKK